MNFPIAERELRVASRNPRMYRGRVIVCAIFWVVTAWMLWATRQIFMMNPAAMAYGWITNIAMMMCMFSCGNTSDSISMEKRAGTLGFLFLTDLRGADVIFGKLTAAGLMAMYVLLAIIPVISMPVLLGGISGESLFKSAVALVNSLFFALSLGLWVSARSWDQKRAANGALWIAILMLWGLPGLAAGLEYRYHWIEVANILKILSPMYQMSHANPFGVGMMFDRYWTSLGITHALAWLLLWRACRVVPHAWQDRPAPVLGRWMKKWSLFRYGSKEERDALRARLLNKNAMHWLTSRDRFGPAAAWIFLAVVVTAWISIWLWANYLSRGEVPVWGVGIPFVFVMQLGLRVRASVIASETLARDRMSGALELLLSSTLKERDVARGIWLSVRRTILGPALATLVVSGIIYWLALRFANETNEAEGARVASFLFFGTSVLFVVDMFSSVRVGMWMSCVAKMVNGAAGMTMLRLLVLPWVLFFGVMTLQNWIGTPRFMRSFEGPFLTWFAICLVNSLIWMRRSRRKFYEQLRLAAAERYQPPPPKRRWWRLWRKEAKPAVGREIVFGRAGG